MIGQTLSINNEYFNRVKKRLRNTGIRVARKGFVQEKEPEKMSWIYIGGNKWRKYPREEKQYMKCYIVCHAEGIPRT